MFRCFAMLCFVSMLSVYIFSRNSLHKAYQSRAEQLLIDARNLNITAEELMKWNAIATSSTRFTKVGPWISFSNPYPLFKKHKLGLPEEKAYLEIKSGDVYLFSAVGLNLTANQYWDFIAITAWEPRKLLGTKFDCCFMYPDKMRQTSVVRKISYKETRGKSMELVQGRQYLCRNPLKDKSRDVPVGMSVIKTGQKCPTDRRYFIQPVLPEMPRSNSFVICAKVVFGNIDANKLIEWIEYQRYFGVTKIVIYLSYDVTDSAIKVINHYSDERIVEVIPVGTVPKQEQQRDWGTKNNFDNVAQDTAVVLFDFQSRCHSYTFGGVIDPDEYILPKDGSTSFIKFMAKILKTKGTENTGYVRLTPEFHVTDWDPDNSSLPMTLLRYKYHTPPMEMSYKNLFVTSRVEHGSIATHTVTAKESSKSFTARPTEAVIRHFRSCDVHKFKNDSYTQCVSGQNKVKDELLDKIATQIYPKVKAVRNRLEIEFS